ncbi:MAG: PAS domain-containing sensor histidine kinase [Hymenobacteraceae bacterium]|nr:PAS domain-containing sensor histidine kinase [Hymenobacteraceae bacterium]
MLSLSPDLANLLLTQVADLISLHDPDSVVRWVSPVAQRLLGYAPEALVGQPWFSLIHPADVAFVAAKFATLFQNPALAPEHQITYRVTHADGTTVWLEGHGRILRDATTSRRTLLVVARDVSARMTAELVAGSQPAQPRHHHAAAESAVPDTVRSDGHPTRPIPMPFAALEAGSSAASLQLQYWQALVDTLPEILWLAGPNSRTTQLLNQRWYDYTGHTAEVLLDQSWVRAMHPADLIDSELQGDSQARIAAGQAYEIKLRLRRHDGAWRWFLMRAVPLRDHAGTLTNWLGLTMDIHERELAERALRRANADLDTFVYAAAHDLKSPIDNLEAVVSALREEFSERLRAYPSPYDDAIATLYDHAERAVSRFRATLADLAQVVDSQAVEPVSQQALDLATHVADLVLDMEAEFVAARGTLCLDLHVPTLRALPARHLRSVLFNLIGNALKYRQPDRPARLWLRTRAIGASWIELALTDNGLGLDSTRAARAFELFGRLHPGAAGGTGIGLFIVRRVVEQAGGKLRVNGRVGEGTTFAIRLPRY